MKILVTGGAGFVGSHLVDALVARGDEVIVVDHHKRDKVRYPNAGATYYNVDFADPAVDDILINEQPDAVVHLAAQISVTHSIAHPVDDAQKNIVDSLGFLSKAAQRAGVKRFVFASSGGAIYGDHAIRPTPLVHDTLPGTPYGIGKQMFEHYLAQSGMAYVALRFANIYGPRQQVTSGGEEGSVIALFLNKLFAGEPLVIFGDGSATRDYLYVDDAVRAFIAALDSDYVGCVNVGTGVETSVQTLADTLLSIHASGGAGSGSAGHPVTHLPFRSGETMRSALAYNSAKEHIGWVPTVTFADGLRKAYDHAAPHA